MAQADDFGFWTCISVEKKFSKKLRFTLEEELRLFENASMPENALTDASLSYKPVKFLTIAAGYRFTACFDEPELQQYFQHRFYGQVGGKIKFSDFEVSLRSQLQETYTSMYSSDNGLIPKIILRNKCQLLYNIYETRFSPFVSVESFFQFYYLGEEGFNKNRFAAGLSFAISQVQQIEGYIMYEQRFNTYKIGASSVAGIKYSYTF